MPELTIITACSRPRNLQTIASAIADNYAGVDVEWLVVFDPNVTTPLETTCPVVADSIEVLYGVAAPGGDPSGAPQKNRGIEDANGKWLHFLDDDTLPYPEVGELFRKIAVSTATCAVVSQVLRNGEHRLTADRNATLGAIDCGQLFLLKSSLGSLRFPLGVYASDFELFRKYRQKPNNVIQEYCEPGAIYNALR